MAVRRYTVELNNTNIGALNRALVGFTLNNAETTENNTSACILYIASVAPQMMAGGSSISGVTEVTAGAAGGFPVPFPVAEYAALQTTLAGANVSAVAMTAYGAAIGGGNLSAIGTSMVVSERTATAGRTGRGRHFLPYVTTAAIDAVGLVILANANNVALSYQQIFADGGFDAVVCPENLSSPKPITSVKVQQVLSNLRTRRR